jgi:hypothetical protein
MRPKVTGIAMLKEYLMEHRPRHLGRKVLRYDVIRSKWSPDEKQTRIVRAKILDGTHRRWIFVAYLDDVVHNVEEGLYESKRSDR